MPAGPYIAPEMCSACQLAANAEIARKAKGEHDLLKQLRRRPYSNPSFWMLEAADEIERLQSAYDGLTPDQYHAGVARLLATLGNPPMDGRDVFTRVADEIVGLQAIINAKLHRRRCHDCGYVGWNVDSISPLVPCDQCRSQKNATAEGGDVMDEITPEIIFRVAELHRTIKEQAEKIERLRAENADLRQQFIDSGVWEEEHPPT